MRRWLQKRKTKKADRQKQELLQVLAGLRRNDTADYIGKTEKRIERFEQQRTSCIDAVLSLEGAEVAPAVTAAVETVKQHAEELETTLKEELEAKRKVKREIEASVEKAVAFIEASSFYPPSFVFDINKLKGMTLDIDEALEKDPLQDIEEMQTFHAQVENEIRRFQEIHEETVGLIGKLEKKMQESGKAEPQRILDIKESLYRHLQLGRMDEARADMKKFRQEIKRF